MTNPDLKAQIAHEFYVALERRGADEELLANVGSWRDTLGDAEVLSMLREYRRESAAPAAVTAGRAIAKISSSRLLPQCD